VPEGDGDRILGQAVQEVGGAVEWVDDPLVILTILGIGDAGLLC